METLPRFFDERAHNLEIYAQKQIFNRMTILNELPMNQNVAGEFTIVFYQINFQKKSSTQFSDNDSRPTFL